MSRRTSPGNKAAFEVKVRQHLTGSDTNEAHSCSQQSNCREDQPCQPKDPSDAAALPSHPPLPRWLDRSNVARAADFPPGSRLDDKGTRLAGALALYAAAGAVIVLGLASIGHSRTIEPAPTPVAAEESATVAAEPCAATMAEFYRLKMGMSYIEAKWVIGCDGEMISQLELSGINTATVKWEAAGNYFGSLIVTFQNKKLVAVAVRAALGELRQLPFGARAGVGHGFVSDD